MSISGLARKESTPPSEEAKFGVDEKICGKSGVNEDVEASLVEGRLEDVEASFIVGTPEIRFLMDEKDRY